MLLYCILEGKKVSIGHLFQKEISACAFKSKGCLFFPSWINELCLRTSLKFPLVMKFWPLEEPLASLLSSGFLFPQPSLCPVRYPIQSCLRTRYSILEHRQPRFSSLLRCYNIIYSSSRHLGLCQGCPHMAKEDISIKFSKETNESSCVSR